MVNRNPDYRGMKTALWTNPDWCVSPCMDGQSGCEGAYASVPVNVSRLGAGSKPLIVAILPLILSLIVAVLSLFPCCYSAVPPLLLPLIKR